MKMMKPCPNCVIRWVEQASSAAQIQLADVARQQLVAALLARRHLILSGPKGVGKLQFADALASSIAQDHNGQVRSILGHPWWAVDTGDISRYVTMQTDFSLWRLLDFMEPIISSDGASSATRSNSDSGILVACVERMSLLEIDMYFGDFLSWLSEQSAVVGHSFSGPGPLRLVGTYDSLEPPRVDHRMKRLAAVIHLERDAISPPVADLIEQMPSAA